MDLAPGKRIRRNLVLVRAIGDGGMASVWTADDLSRKRRVAVKILAPELAGSTEAVERFSSEAKILAAIHSPFVPEVYDRGTLADGTPFTVMELLEGTDFDVYLRARGRLSLKATARLVFHIAAALDAAHAIGIIHRDVKAENIFILGNGDDLVAKLFDFGIAKVPFRTHRTHMGMMIGTPAYMSPEQLASAKDVDRRADLWSLAIVAYLALTDALPFEGETFGAVCVAIHKGGYTPVTRIEASLPREIDAWFERALHRDLGARFATAKELSDAFGAVAAVTESEAVACATRPSLPSGPLDGRRSVGGMSRTRRVAREPRRAPAVALVLACAAAFAYSSWPTRGLSWLQRRATRSIAVEPAPAEAAAPPSAPTAVTFAPFVTPACEPSTSPEPQPESDATEAPPPSSAPKPHDDSPRPRVAKRRPVAAGDAGAAAPPVPIAIGSSDDSGDGGQRALDAQSVEDVPAQELNSDFGLRE